MEPFARTHRREGAARPRTLHCVQRWLVLAGFGISGLLAGPAHAIDFGDASVLSQQEQRLRLAIPFGSVPGERISVTRFSVVAAEAEPGHASPVPSSFLISTPAQRNVVFFATSEPFTGSTLRLTVQVDDGAETRATYALRIPPFRATLVEILPDAMEVPAAPPPRRGARHRGKGRATR